MRRYAHTLYAIFCFEDWRTEARKTSFGPVSSKSRSRSTGGQEKFYQDLKRSASEGVQASTSNATTAGNELGFKHYIPADQASNEERLRNVCTSIKTNQRKRVELYAVLGVQLAYMKFYYISNRCDNCILDNDPYVTITCLSCLKSNKNVKDFIAKAVDITSYTKDYVNFFIRLGKLCTLYPKIIYAAPSTADLKKYLKYATKKMELESPWWQL